MAANYQIIEENIGYFIEEKKDPRPDLDEAIEECSFEPGENYCIVDINDAYQNYINNCKADKVAYVDPGKFMASIHALFKNIVVFYGSKKRYLVGPKEMFKSLHAHEKKRGKIK